MRGGFTGRLAEPQRCFSRVVASNDEITSFCEGSDTIAMAGT